MPSDSLLRKESRRLGARLELFEQRTRSTSFLAKGGQVRSRQFGRSVGYALRLLRGNRLGFASFERERDFSRALKSALKSARQQEPAPYFFAPPRKAVSRAFFDPTVQETSPSTFLERVEGMVEAARQLKAEPIEAGFTVTATDQRLWNSEGMDVRQRFSRFSSFAHCARGPAEADDSFSSWRFSFDPSETARRAAGDAVRMQKAQKTASREMPLVFDVHALSALFSLFLPFHFDGESVRKGLGRWKAGDAAMASGISLHDDPLLLDGEACAEYDDEGFPARRQPLVEDGRVRSFLHDASSAAKSGKPAGNGWRSSYEAPPNASFSNLVVGGGHLKDAVAECRDGLYVRAFLTSGANAVTGDFSFPLLTAFRIKNGQLGQGVKGAMFRGNFFDLLKTARFEQRQEAANGLKSGRMLARARVVS